MSTTTNPADRFKAALAKARAGVTAERTILGSPTGGPRTTETATALLGLVRRTDPSALRGFIAGRTH